MIWYGFTAAAVILSVFRIAQGDVWMALFAAIIGLACAIQARRDREG